MYEILLTIIIIYLIHLCLCGIIHVINGSQWFPRNKKELFIKHFNIFWLLFNLKKVRKEVED